MTLVKWSLIHKSLSFYNFWNYLLILLACKMLSWCWYFLSCYLSRNRSSTSRNLISSYHFCCQCQCYLSLWLPWDHLCVDDGIFHKEKRQYFHLFAFSPLPNTLFSLSKKCHHQSTLGLKRMLKTNGCKLNLDQCKFLP